jgi:hypothetical protein
MPFALVSKLRILCVGYQLGLVEMVRRLDCHRVCGKETDYQQSCGYFQRSSQQESESR